MIYFENEYAIVEFISNRRVVKMHWKNPHSDSACYRLTLTKALVITKQYDVKGWLSDLSNLSFVRDEDLQWIMCTVAPSMKRYPSLKKIAFVGEKKILDLFNTEIMRISSKKGRIKIKYFKTEKPAVKWLLRRL